MTSPASARYLRAVSSGMDYILGRNPNVKSYVSGYGDAGAREPDPPLLGAPGEPGVPGARAGRRRGRAERAARRPVRRLGPRRLRAAEVLRRQHRVVLHQRDRDQLERAARLGGRLPRQRLVAPRIGTRVAAAGTSDEPTALSARAGGGLAPRRLRLPRARRRRTSGVVSEGESSAPPMPAARPPITIRDVAAAAGVSVATVSRVLSGSVPVAAEKTRRRARGRRAPALLTPAWPPRVSRAASRGRSASWRRGSPAPSTR